MHIGPPEVGGSKWGVRSETTDSAGVAVVIHWETAHSGEYNESIQYNTVQYRIIMIIRVNVRLNVM